MDLLIFILIISALTGLSVWTSKILFSKKAGLIFMPASLLLILAFISGTLASVIDDEIALLYAVGVFIFAPSGLITLVYALNHHYVHKKNT